MRRRLLAASEEIYPPGQAQFEPTHRIGNMRAALKEAAPEGLTVNLTGRDPLYEDVGGTEGPRGRHVLAKRRLPRPTSRVRGRD
jgi:hypothetical protein